MMSSVEDALHSRVQRLDLVETLAAFASTVEYDALPLAVIDMAKIFIMDSLAVGVAAVGEELAEKALVAAELWGEGRTRVVGRAGHQLSRPSAAFMNGMQVHALEWDGLHELSVVIAMCAPMGAIAAEIDHQTISGRELIRAIVIGVEIAVFFGGDTASSPRFFRPSAAGGMGATASLAILRGFSQSQLIQALGLAHAQTAGTMQAHWEGSMALPMQVGNASRLAHLSVDMVAAGMDGPVDFIDGRFGYFKLFESGGDIEQSLANLGAPYKITDMAHKPYPAGRATQAALTMIREIRSEHSFDLADIEKIVFFVPPLIMLLVGRPITNTMTPSYARLCLRFIVPLMLVDGAIDPRRFVGECFADERIQGLARRLEIEDDGNADSNALGPQRMVIRLTDGRVLSASCDTPLGSPGNALTKQAREDKVRHCLQLGAMAERAEPFIALCNDLESIADTKCVLDLLC